MKSAGPIDDYIASFPKETQAILQKVRRAIRQELPRAEETIKYGIPTFMLAGKNVIHFGGHQKHVGVYPVPRGVEEFREELAAYEGGKGTAQFPYDEPLPLELIRRIARFRAGQSR